MNGLWGRPRTSLMAGWLTRTKKTPELNHLYLSHDLRTRHIPKVVDDMPVGYAQPLHLRKNFSVGPEPSCEVPSKALR